MFKKALFAAGLAACLAFSAQAQKFGVVNTQEIFNVMPERLTAESTLKTAGEKYEAEFKNLQEAFQKKLEEYQKAEEDPATPQAIKDRHNEELQADYQKIQNFQQTAAQDLQRQQDTLIGPISQKLQDAIKAVGAEGGYTFIFDLASPTVVYYGTGNGAEDVNAKVKAKLGIQ